MSSYRLDLNALTVIRADAHGEEHDLNADGEPCEDFAGLLTLASDLGLIICKYADPTEGAREGLTVDEAIGIMDEDPSLIYLQGISTARAEQIIEEERMGHAHVGASASLVLDDEGNLTDDQHSEPADLSSEAAFRAQVVEWRESM